MNLTIITDDRDGLVGRGRNHNDGSDALAPGRKQRTYLVCDLDRPGGAYPGKVLMRYRTRREAKARIAREIARLLDHDGLTQEFDNGPMTDLANAIHAR